MFRAGILCMVVSLSLAGCNQGGYGQTNPANSAVLRTVGGAAAGALIAGAVDGSGTKGALVGALAGGLSCTSGQCH